MHQPGTGKAVRLIRQHFLNADLETGFTLLRAANESETTADRISELRQMEDARCALNEARRRYREMHEQDAGKFSARLADLERATDLRMRTVASES